MENKYYKMVNGYKVRNSHFPVGIFIMTFVAFLVTAALQYAIIVLIENMDWSWWLVVIFVLAYWLVISLGFTLFTRWQINRSYEEPLKEIAKATNEVANGDFSVYIPVIHTPEKLDYLDIMIEDFNKMVEELGSIETLKTDFFSNVSHEIKTPIAVIQNSSELLKKTELTKEQEAELNNIFNASRKLSTLITNILKLSKLEKQAIKPELVNYDLSRQLCDSVILFEDQWEKKNIELDLDIEDSVFVNSDPELMDLVWNNLISNAIKFSENNGKISIKEESNEDEIVVLVSDSGCGMDDETKKKVFDKFYQGDSSHKTEGNGLGLALVSRILQLLDGDISVSSKLGEGSTFVVSLPRKK